MRMIIKKIFSYSELPAGIRKKIRNDQAAIEGYQRAEECVNSLEELAKRFGSRMNRYNIDFFSCSHSFAEFVTEWEGDELTREEIGRRLAQLGSYDPTTLRGLGDCVLTGDCVDETAIDAFRLAFMAGVSDLEKLLQAAFSAVVKEGQEDCEHQYSDETFKELCEGEFYADGKPYSD